MTLSFFLRGEQVEWIYLRSHYLFIWKLFRRIGVKKLTEKAGSQWEKTKLIEELYNCLLISVLCNLDWGQAMKFRGVSSSPAQCRCVVFLGKTLFSHSPSLRPHAPGCIKPRMYWGIVYGRNPGTEFTFILAIKEGTVVAFLELCSSFL